ncbi:MAG: hypothetical protein ACLRPX_09975 [Ruthenibacterium sp.]
MKRMTSNEYNPCFNCNFYSSCSHIRENFPVCPERARYDRLAAIEDILGDEYDLDKLREMVQAKREGRCVVLPCKIDDDVYINLFGRTLDATVISISELASTPTYKAMYGIRLCYIFKADDVGRTVFLTREAAEEALKAREQE